MSQTLLRYLLEDNLITEKQFKDIAAGASKGDMQIFADIRRRDIISEPQLLKAVCKFYDLPYADDVSEYRIDMSMAEKLGGLREMRNNLFAPVQDGIMLAADPFCRIPMSRAIVTSRENIVKLIHAIDHCEPASKDDPGEALQKILTFGVSHCASDIHIYFEPFNKSTVVKFRVDGMLKVEDAFTMKNPDHDYHHALINKIFSLSGVDPSQFLDIWDRRFTATVMNREINIRLSVIPMPEKTSAIVMRLLYQRHSSVTPVDKLGFDSHVVDVLRTIIREPYGLVLISGPTGSGKTTTLYSMLNEKKREPVCIVSVEDPVEVRLEGIRQVEVKKKDDPSQSITFATATRAFLRHDPDVILIGEIRDEETAKEAMKAAQTGHLVFSTIHTNTACGVIQRLVDLGTAPERVASILRLSLAQRLVRLLCECKQHITNQQMKGEFKAQYGAKAALFQTGVYIPKGCPLCNNEGYRGRIPIPEVLAVNNYVKKLITTMDIADEERLLRTSGFDAMSKNAIRLIERGITSIDEVERYVALTPAFEQSKATEQDRFSRARIG